MYALFYESPNGKRTFAARADDQIDLIILGRIYSRNASHPMLGVVTLPIGESITCCRFDKGEVTDFTPISATGSVPAAMKGPAEIKQRSAFASL